MRRIKPWLPLAILGLSFSPSAQAAQTVVLVHGIDDSQTALKQLKKAIEEKAHKRCITFDMVPNDGRVGLDALAHQLADQINQLPDQKVDLVGFSLGGVVSRYYLQRLDGFEHVERLVTISSPHHGTWMAFARWNPLAEELRPNSAVLTQLNRDWDPRRIPHTVIWTPFDLMIVPSTSSRMPGAKEVQVPVLLHPWMLDDKRCHEAVCKALEAKD